jgi:hypothetical protein
MYMEEVEGFEPPRAFTPLSVFKTDPFSRTWVYLRVTDKNYINMAVDRVSTFFQKKLKKRGENSSLLFT